MIYRNGDRQIVFQNYEFGYAFMSFRKYQKLSIHLKDTGLDYSPIGPTILVEWEDE